MTVRSFSRLLVSRTTEFRGLLTAHRLFRWTGFQNGGKANEDGAANETRIAFHFLHRHTTPTPAVFRCRPLLKNDKVEERREKAGWCKNHVNGREFFEHALQTLIDLVCNSGSFH